MNLTCLQEVFNEDDFIELQNILSGLPNGEADNLRLLNALLIKQLNDENDGGVTIISSATFSVTDAPAIVIPAIPDGAKGAYITSYGEDIWFTIAGDDPSPGDVIGHLLPAETTLDTKFISTMKIVSASATPATIYITFYK